MTKGSGNFHKSLKRPLSPSSSHLQKEEDSSQVDNGASSSDSDSDEEVVPLMERRARNEQRNKAFLSRLNLEYGVSKQKKRAGMTKDKIGKVEGTVASFKDEMCEPGMLFSTPFIENCRGQNDYNDLIKISEISDRYPFRDSQIYKLTGYFEVALSQARSRSTFVPSPMFITGPSGVGKTAVVRFCVDWIKQQGTQSFKAGTHATLLEGYVDSATLDEHSIDEVIRCVLRQMRSQSMTGESKLPITRVDAEAADDKPENENNESNERKTLRERQALPGGKRPPVGASAKESTYSLSTSVWSFGCDLKCLLHGGHCGIIVLDNADKIATINATKGGKDRVNFLSQLLLLPRLLNLNLCVVAITRSLLLEHSSLSANNSIGSVCDDIQPQRLHFPPYREKGMITTIMQRRENQISVFGAVAASSLELKIRISFLAATIQSLQDVTVDLRDIMNACRKLWPVYISPLETEKMRSRPDFLSAAQDCNQDAQRKVLMALERKFLPHLRRHHERGSICNSIGGSCSAPLSMVGLVQSVHELAPLSKLLLLAAFLCQTNKADRDKELFSIKKNGKRRAESSLGARRDEDIAFGTGMDEIKSLRRKSFPAERLFSVFVSVLSFLDEDQKISIGLTKHVSSQVLRYGIFGELVAYARDIGMLLDHGQKHILADLKLSCVLTREEAWTIARSIRFPLDRFLQ